MQDMQPDNSAVPVDNEGAMAKADLYKLANYSFKLFKQIDGNAQLEGWVQAKITKAADYIASVYHYMEYEMKFSEYGEQLENSDMYSESEKHVMMSKLMEAKDKVKELKKKQADKVGKKDMPVKEEKSSTGGEIDRSKKGVTKHKQNPDRFSDEPHTEPKSNAKSQSAADKAGDKAADKAEEKEGKNWEKRFGKDSVTRVKDGKKVDEALKGAQKKLDTDNDKDIDAKDLANLRAKKKVKEATDEKCNHTAKGKKCPVHGLKECGGMYEAAKPDFLDINNNGNKKEPMKKAVADKKAGPKKGVNPFAKKDTKVKEAITKAKAKMEGKPSATNTALKGLSGAAALYFGGKAIKTAAEIAKEKEDAKKNPADTTAAVDPKKAADAAATKPGTIKESADLDRVKTLTKHLLG